MVVGATLIGRSAMCCNKAVSVSLASIACSIFGIRGHPPRQQPILIELLMLHDQPGGKNIWLWSDIPLVLTDRDFFQGSAGDLKSAREACSLPVLRKDFMIDPYQVYEARALSADCILIIMASLSDAQAAELEQTAFSLGMDVLIEVHDRDELDRAARLKSPLIGINNRNLHSFDVTLDTTRDLVRRAPEDRLIVSESGLFTPDDLADMARYGARCFLIGESLMRQADVAAATRAILANPGPLSHLDDHGQAHMVDVSAKPVTDRMALAEGFVVMQPDTLALVLQGTAKKGDVLGIARLAGIMGAKRTSDLIPLCHPLPITKVTLDLTPDPALPGLRITASVKTAGQTGVEMEALTAVSIACLTVYDMLKAADKSMQITGIRLLVKEGGKSGRYEAAP
ncbi:MAG: cyclic pyranopterin monophosphate synthase MoaC [Rhodobacteraceae bacterium]|nr:cyclic pyranopterin monophosphate synthase MoaC [Paracoccaceae bacterium]